MIAAKEGRSNGNATVFDKDEGQLDAMVCNFRGEKESTQAGIYSRGDATAGKT